MREIDKAVNLLTPLLEGMAKDRDDSVKVYTCSHTGSNSIVVIINECTYEVDVTAENMRSMIKSVIDAVALKF